jgi:hypothetical protein
MQTFKLEVTIVADGKLEVEGSPLHKGDHVEMIVNRSDLKESANGHYPLRGTPYRYTEPFEPVADTDWDTLK